MSHQLPLPPPAKEKGRSTDNSTPAVSPPAHPGGSTLCWESLGETEENEVEHRGSSAEFRRNDSEVTPPSISLSNLLSTTLQGPPTPLTSKVIKHREVGRAWGLQWKGILTLSPSVYGQVHPLTEPHLLICTMGTWTRAEQPTSLEPSGDCHCFIGSSR